MPAIRSLRLMVLLGAALIGVLLAAAPASAWNAFAQPLGGSPEAGAAWNFSILLRNAENASIQVTGFFVWTDGGDAPTLGGPRATSTPLPVSIRPGASANFSFDLQVPAGTAGRRYTLEASAEVAEALESGGWGPSSAAQFGNGWDFIVRAPKPPASPDSSTVGSRIGNLILLALVLGGWAATGRLLLWPRSVFPVYDRPPAGKRFSESPPLAEPGAFQAVVGEGTFEPWQPEPPAHPRDPPAPPT